MTTMHSNLANALITHAATETIFSHTWQGMDHSYSKIDVHKHAQNTSQ